MFPWKFLSNYLMFHFLTFWPKNSKLHTCQPPKYQNLDVYTLRKSPESLSNVPKVDNSMEKPHQPSTIYCAIWLVDFWPVMLLVKICQFDSSSLYFLIENSSDKSTKSISCFIIFFDISKIMKLMKTFWKRSRDICWQTWRLPGKQGELAGMKLYLEEGNNNL